MPRGKESIDEEKKTRAMMIPFLEGLGFSGLSQKEKGHGQTINGFTPQGVLVSMRVKLCWRLGMEGKRRGYSAAQIRMVKSGDLLEAVVKVFEGWKKEGNTHLLLVQKEGEGFRHAGLVPMGSSAAVWEAQRAECDRLIEAGENGRKARNQAENGRSPTIWLEDDQAESVAAVFWNYPGVVNLLTGFVQMPVADDTYDDLYDPDLGRDEGLRYISTHSGVRRDPAVRRAVLARSGRRCERAGCGASRDFNGFIDVHHVLGAEKSDRLWTCVALCPNCHREAHFSPQSEDLNAELLRFAKQYYEGL